MKRRDFLKASALFGGVMILPSALAAKVKGANSRANIAIIGWGGQGKSSVDTIFNSNDANIVALCDVDEGYAAYCYRDDRGKFLMQNIGSLPKFKDYRVMLDKMDSDIDGVCVCTPDHSHSNGSKLWASSSASMFCLARKFRLPAPGRPQT